MDAKVYMGFSWGHSLDRRCQSLHHNDMIRVLALGIVLVSGCRHYHEVFEQPQETVEVLTVSEQDSFELIPFLKGPNFDPSSLLNKRIQPDLRADLEKWLIVSHTTDTGEVPKLSGTRSVPRMAFVDVVCLDARCKKYEVKWNHKNLGVVSSSEQAPWLKELREILSRVGNDQPHLALRSPSNVPATFIAGLGKELSAKYKRIWFLSREIGQPRGVAGLGDPPTGIAKGVQIELSASEGQGGAPKVGQTFGEFIRQLVEAGGDSFSIIGATVTGPSIAVQGDQIVFGDKIYFQTGKAIIDGRSFTLLDGVASIIRANPAMKVRIEGHTDNVGNATQNKTLSQRRAGAVRSYLIRKQVAAGRMTAVGFGSDKPVATNATEEGKAQNRRVDFIVVP